MQRKSTVTGRFMKRFKKNQRVFHKGSAWRVCKDVMVDATLGKSPWDHRYYKLQRGTKVQYVRADYIQTRSQLEAQEA
jgi:hypothetical protein